MSAQNGKTIQIYLPMGEPRGLRIAEITTRNVRAIQAPRNQLEKLFERPEASQPACYFLFGESDTPGKGMVYIGQTEDLKGRLKAHDDTKDFWNSAVAIFLRPTPLLKRTSDIWSGIPSTLPPRRIAINATMGTKVQSPIRWKP